MSTRTRPSRRIVAVGVLAALIIAGAIGSIAQAGASHSRADSDAQHRASSAPFPEAGAEDSSPIETTTPTATVTKTPTARPSATPTTASKADQAALTALATLAVRPMSAATKYDRVVDFGTAWLDVDHNGCDTRDDILTRDLTHVVRSGACTVLSGVLRDPYTGATISFTRGVTTSAAVQIDHVVPLGDAWETGASLLTQAQREALANDPLNLLAVDGPTNESKSDKDASQWLPPNSAYDCPYVARQVAVKAAYHLWVTSAERAAMASILSRCPTQSTPPRSAVTSSSGGSAPVPAPSKASTAPPAPAAAPAPAPKAPTNSGTRVVHPGAFCAPAGATGVTTKGTHMVCGPTANSARARWHSG